MKVLVVEDAPEVADFIHTCFNMSIPEAQAFAGALEYNVSGMEDSLEGVRAFNEKRKPVFKNQ